MIAQQQNIRAATPVLIGVEVAPERRDHAKNRKEVRCNGGPRNPHRVSDTGQRVLAIGVESRKLLERSSRGSSCNKVRINKRG